MSASTRYLSSHLRFTLLVGLFLGATTFARASTGAQYVAIRKEKHYNASLTYAKIQSDPTRYIGQVFEIAGKVGGTISSGYW